MSEDLFGETPDSQPTAPGRGPQGGKHYTRPRGYAGTPGAGPQDKKCRNCANYAVVCGGAKSYPKCVLTRTNWTRGRGSDILAGSPACQYFEEPKQEVPSGGS